MDGGQQLGARIEFKRRAAGQPEFGQERSQRSGQWCAGNRIGNNGLCRKPVPCGDAMHVAHGQLCNALHPAGHREAWHYLI
ncbi:hypothetical protein RSSE_c3738 [Ralstonia solanacearum]|nr:hypothetical protein RSSE_c3738 [Ralstonia solanacearum]